MGQHARTSDMVDQLVDVLGSGPWRREVILAAGWTPGQIRRAVEAGRLARPFRGVLAPAAHRGASSSGPRLSEQVRQALCSRMEIANDRAAVSHASAAEWSQMWAPTRLDDLHHLTIDGAPDSCDAKVRIHGSSLPESLVHVVRGLRTGAGVGGASGKFYFATSSGVGAGSSGRPTDWASTEGRSARSAPPLRPSAIASAISRTRAGRSTGGTRARPRRHGSPGSTVRWAVLRTRSGTRRRAFLCIDGCQAGWALVRGWWGWGRIGL